MTSPTRERVAVRNASDPRQVKAAAESEKMRVDRELADMATMLSNPIGRRVLERILGYCEIYGSIMETNARIYYRAGRQDVGHWLLAEIGRADPKAFLVMMAEKAKLDDFIVPVAPTEEEPE